MGFDGRMFLTPEEHATYLRRPPVRYAAKGLIAPSACEMCGGVPTTENPLQVAHRVPFLKGVQVWKLTPDWLDSRDNLVWAHRKICNTAAEMTDEQIANALSLR